MAGLRLGVNGANVLGVLVLLVGAGMGFFADRLCGRFWPDQPQRAMSLRLIGLGLALAGALWAING